MRSITIALNISLLTLALGNCFGDPPLGPDSTEEARLPEQLGIVLTASEVNEYSSLGWSPNGTKIFYESSQWSGSSGIKVVDVATRPRSPAIPICGKGRSRDGRQPRKRSVVCKKRPYPK